MPWYLYITVDRASLRHGSTTLDRELDTSVWLEQGLHTRPHLATSGADWNSARSASAVRQLHPCWQHTLTALPSGQALQDARSAAQVSVHCHEHAALLRRTLQRRDEREAEQQRAAEQLRRCAAASAEAAADSERRAAVALAEAEHAGQQRRNAEVEVETLRTRVRDMQAKTDEMILKYRRCAARRLCWRVRWMGAL